MEDINILIINLVMSNESILRCLSKNKSIGHIYVVQFEDRQEFNDFNKIEYVNIPKYSELENFIQKSNINFAIVGLQDLNSLSVTNYIKYNLKIPTIGITRYWQQLELSKFLGKKFMTKYNIPVCPFRIIKNTLDLKNCINEFGFPLVLKNDKLKAGFGSYICKNEKEVNSKAKELLKENNFCIAEKYIKGEEVTLFHLWDGKNLVSLEPVRDYKKLENGNKGINTGSMGAYMPVKLSEKKRQMIDNYSASLEKVFQQIKPNFTGIFASDLIFNDNEIYNLEFNMRPCTPEFEVLLEHLDTDLFEILYNTANSNLNNLRIKYKTGITGAVNVVHKDYAKQYEFFNRKKLMIPDDFLHNDKGIVINNNFYKISKNKGEFFSKDKIFVVLKNDQINPFPAIYKHLEKLKDKQIFYRTDIGAELTNF